MLFLFCFRYNNWRLHLVFDYWCFLFRYRWSIHLINYVCHMLSISFCLIIHL